MPTQADFALASSLQQARESLQSSIEQAVHAYEQQIDGPLELRLDMTNGAVAPENATAGERELYGAVRSLVEQFLQNPAVQQSGMRVRHVTAIDSDADGTAAVNVKYAYADES
ncbi:MAG: hypothetical protein R3247_01965 [Rhodothermales bacterium]|nr:hypothetical protein [Rhodothermales bacterium]